MMVSRHVLERVYMPWPGRLPRCNARRRLQRHARICVDALVGFGMLVAADGIWITRIAWLRSAMRFAGLWPGNFRLIAMGVLTSRRRKSRSGQLGARGAFEFIHASWTIGS